MKGQHPYAKTALNHGNEINLTYLSFRAQQALGIVPGNVAEL